MSSKLEILKDIRKEINLEVLGDVYKDDNATNIYIANHNCLKDS